MLIRSLPECSSVHLDVERFRVCVCERESIIDMYNNDVARSGSLSLYLSIYIMLRHISPFLAMPDLPASEASDGVQTNKYPPPLIIILRLYATPDLPASKASEGVQSMRW
jgi:hypothetical protein